MVILWWLAVGKFPHGVFRTRSTLSFWTCIRAIFEYAIEVWKIAIQGKDRDKFRSTQGNRPGRALSAVKSITFK